MRSLLLEKNRGLWAAILLMVFSVGGVLFPLHSAHASYLGNQLLAAILKVLGLILELFAQLGTWLLGLVSEVLGSVVAVGSFVTNPFVTQGWPFLQGLANFGFILALLVIAVTTALRMDIGGGARRLLPRLLLGAILINFSLLIGGILIDVSRLLMALFANLALAGKQNIDSVGDLGPSILESSRLVTSVFEINMRNPFFKLSTKFAVDDIGPFLRVLQASVFIWGLMIGMFVITITLLIRYVMLILLLIVSPLVYVAIAFPGAGGIAKKWWSSFLTNVFYGPIAMFALVMLAVVGPTTGSFDGIGRTAIDFLGLVITVVLLFVVATSGRNWGAAGANFAVNATRGTGNWVRRNPVKASTIAGAMATGGVGGALLGAGAAVLGRAGARGVRDTGRSAVSTATDRLRSGKAFGGGKTGRLAQIIAGPKRDDKGNLKEGESTAFSRLGESLGSPAKNRERKAAKKAGQDASTVIGKDANKVPTAITVEQLLNPDTVASLSKDAYAATLQSPSTSHIQAVVTGTIKQKEVSKEQAQTVVVQLHDTATNNPDPAKRTLAKSLLEEVLRQKKFVDKLGDAETKKVFDINDKKLTQTLIRTLSKEEKKS